MESVYVMEPGSYLRREGATLKVVKGSTVSDQIPAEGLKRVMRISQIQTGQNVEAGSRFRRFWRFTPRLAPALAIK